MVLTLEAKVFAAADAAVTDGAETNWKHKSHPDRGDLIMWLHKSIISYWLHLWSSMNNRSTLWISLNQIKNT